MVSIFPFRGLRYNPDKVNLNDVTAPPYDVIDEKFQQVLYDRHPANIVRLILNQKTDNDSETNSMYTRAAWFLKDWEQQGILTPENQPAIYAYSQNWDGITRRGAIVLLRLETFESGNVLPHEHTLKGPKIDRLNLMKATLCNLSQIFMIYSDPARMLETLLFEKNRNTDDWLEATDEHQVVHRFQPVTDAGVIESIQALFEEKNLLIADGHHRYETALVFQQEVRERIRRETGQDPPPGSLLSDYVMVFVTNMDDPGLKVFPTHRVIMDWPHGFTPEIFNAELLKYFDPVDSDETFTYVGGPGGSVKFRLKPEYQPNLPPLLQHYDAAILEEVVFKGILGQTGEAMKTSHHLGFYRDEAEIDRLLASGEAKAVFYLEAPDVKLVHRICKSGHRMPQKSTYFYPKILSGLVLYPYRPFLKGDQHALSHLSEVQPLADNLFLLQPQT